MTFQLFHNLYESCQFQLTGTYTKMILNSKIFQSVTQKMVKFNPGLSKILNKVFLSKNMQLELKRDCGTFAPRYSNDNTKCYSKQYTGRKNTKPEQNFNPGLALIGLSETIACEEALCLGKNSKEREGKGGERACRQTFEAAIPPSCNYLAEHLSVRSLSVNQFRAWVTLEKINGKWAMLRLKTKWNGTRA